MKSSHCRAGWVWSQSERLEVPQWRPLLVEDEAEHSGAILLALPDEGAHVSLPRDVEGHLALGPGHLELHVAGALCWCCREVEGHVAERKLERDLLVVDGARAEQRQRLRRHRHRHVHRGHSVVFRHRRVSAASDLQSARRISEVCSCV